jgi:hypothetical protein
MAIWLALYGLFAITFARFQIRGDALVYFNLMRRFFGEHPDFAFAYQFGSNVWNAPFFLAGRLCGALFGHEPHIFHVSFEEIWTTIAAQAAFLTILYVGWRLLRDLRLPAGASVLFVTALGSPLFFYVVFDPAMKHATDTLYVTAAVFLLLRILRGARDLDAALLGALVGVSVNTRYVNVAFFFVVGCGLLFANRRRALAVSLSAAVVVGAVLYSLPALRGIPYFHPTYFPKSAVARLAIGPSPTLADTRNPLNGFDPLIPLKMLFSAHRGLFFWTPLTFLGTIGFLLRLRSERDQTVRRFLWILLLASAALVLSHVTWAEWDGAFSFSSRFLTALFPLELIGVAELVRRFRGYVYVPFAACIVWSFILLFIHVVGYDGITAGDSALTELSHLRLEPQNLRHKVDHLAIDRWTYLWGLVVHGEDPEHVHGP